MPRRKVLIAGASGLIGHAAAAHFASLPDWDVVGVSRRLPDDLPGVTLESVDLTDAEACARVFGAMQDVTHVVYAALQEEPGLYPGWTDPALIERNGTMLRNLFDPLLRAATGLEHVSLLHGTKAYGLHHPSVDPARVHIPLRERDPRIEHPNFYFVQESYLQEQQQRGSWGLTVFRPTVVYGDAPGNNMNPILALGVYAALERVAGRALDFPGAGDDPSLHEAVDANLIARALAWAATSPSAAGGTFNLTNGDVFLWEHVWPAVAERFGMAPGVTRPQTLAEELPRRDAEWAAIVDRYGLEAPRSVVEFVGYNSLVYADGVLSARRRRPIPTLNSTIAVRQAGFADCMDTEDMFRDCFRRLQEARRLPPPA